MKKTENFYEIEKYNPSEFPFVAMTIGHSDFQTTVEREQGWGLNQFLWVTDGEGMFKVNRETFSLSKGQGLFTKIGISHSYSPSGNTFSTSWVTFLSGESLLKFYGAEDWFVFDVPDFLEKSREQLSSQCFSAKSLASRSALGYLWVTELLDAISIHELSVCEKVQHFLFENCSQPLTLDQIASEAGMNKFNLCKHYRKKTGETIMDTLKSTRVRRAKRLLRYGLDSIYEVGQQCGFDSVSYFIKNFREEVGCTPLQYRQNKHK